MRGAEPQRLALWTCRRLKEFTDDVLEGKNKGLQFQHMDTVDWDGIGNNALFWHYPGPAREESYGFFYDCLSDLATFYMQ